MTTHLSVRTLFGTMAECNRLKLCKGIVAAVGVGSPIGLGYWLVANQPSALADSQSASSRHYSHKGAVERGVWCGRVEVSRGCFRGKPTGDGPEAVTGINHPNKYFHIHVLLVRLMWLRCRQTTLSVMMYRRSKGSMQFNNGCYKYPISPVAVNAFISSQPKPLFQFSSLKKCACSVEPANLERCCAWMQLLWA